MLANKLMTALAGGTEEKLYVDDVFSTYLYTGNGGTQTINNGIDLAGKGGLVWAKIRSNSFNHELFDTARGTKSALISNDTFAAQAHGPYSFNANGFGFGSGYAGNANTSGQTYTSWTFRKAPKFFDVVTYTGNGVAGRQIPHDLGIAPGMVIVKRIDATGEWFVFHKDAIAAGTGPTARFSALLLNNSAAVGQYSTVWNETLPTATDFTIGTTLNANGAQYVAYLFAHDPGEDGIIQCGSYTGDGNTSRLINLGWEPQFVITKRVDSSGEWMMYDTMRGMSVGMPTAEVYANVTSAEYNGLLRATADAQGFRLLSSDGNVNYPGYQYIYLAIRRPNKPPKSGTEVYVGAYRGGSAQSSPPGYISGFPVDMYINRGFLNVSAINFSVFDRLRGQVALKTNLTNAETSSGTNFAYMNGVEDSVYNDNRFSWMFRRAHGFFDIVCYTGTGVARTVPHGLGVAPELMIIKGRSGNSDWSVYHKDLGVAANKALYLNGNYYAGQFTGDMWGATSPTSSVFSLTAGGSYNSSGATIVWYGFASLPGISKVGSYAGNGSSQTIDCGFSTGARFILIKRTDAVGDWYVWDTARGIVAANDPHLSLNTTAAEVTTDDSVDPHASGFIVNQVAATNINVSGGQYIFLAIS